MRAGALTAAGFLLVPILLSGCLSLPGFGSTDEQYDPLEYEPTGRTLRFRAFVDDHEQEVWPGFTARFWSFCIQGLDDASKAAVEYQTDGEPCSVPGPTLRVKQGDKIVVEFTNGHRFPHTIHWHGMVLPNAMDGAPGTTQDTVVKGTKYVYEFEAARPGTLFYHCHVDTQRHMFMGLYGALIVEPQDPRFEPDVDKDYTFVLGHGNRTLMDTANPEQDPEHSGHVDEQNDKFDPGIDIFMINGKSFPNTLKDPRSFIHVSEGERVRVRLVNAGHLAESIHTHGHDMLVTHKDGLPLPQPYWADTVAIHPGERYDVVIAMENPGKWVMHTHYTMHVTNGHVYPGGMLTAMVYEGYEDQGFAHESNAAPPSGSTPPPNGTGSGGGNDTGNASTPADFSETHEDTVTSASYTEEYGFSVEDARALEARAKLTWTSVIPTSQATVTIAAPDGTEACSATASSNGQTVNCVVTEPVAGAYTAHVTANGVNANYVLELTVDYAGNDGA